MPYAKPEFAFDSESWTKSRERYEAFWNGECVDRPVLQLHSGRPDAVVPAPEDIRPREPEALFRWYMDPACVIPRLNRWLARKCWAGDAFPCVFPVSTSLAAIQAAYLGGAYRIAPENGSGWCDPSIHDWSARAELVVDPANDWWRRTKNLMAAGAEAFTGRAMVGIPDIQGGGQILASLRGTEELAMDLVDHPEAVHRALEEVDRTWLVFWQACNEPVLRHQRGYVDWLGIWSDKPAVTVECDFSIMISPEMYATYFLPSVRRQTGWVGRTLYHLDGAGAIRHLDALLAIEALGGIQWVPGAGAAPMRTWGALLKRIQQAGKRLVIGCGAAEVLPLLKELSPCGLCVSASTRTPEEAEDLVRQVTKIKWK